MADEIVDYAGELDLRADTIADFDFDFGDSATDYLSIEEDADFLDVIPQVPEFEDIDIAELFKPENVTTLLEDISSFESGSLDLAEITIPGVKGTFVEMPSQTARKDEDLDYTLYNIETKQNIPASQVMGDFASTSDDSLSTKDKTFITLGMLTLGASIWAAAREDDRAADAAKAAEENSEDALELAWAQFEWQKESTATPGGQVTRPNRSGVY